MQNKLNLEKRKYTENNNYNRIKDDNKLNIIIIIIL